MADIALVVAGRVSQVQGIGYGRQRTLVAGEAITAGAPVYIDANGKWINGNGGAAGTARIYGLATKTVIAQEPLTVVKLGTFDGFELSGLAYDAPVYLSNTVGRLADAAGTVSVLVGRVVPANAVLLGTVPDKLLEVDL